MKALLKEKHLLKYVEGCVCKVKVFKTTKALNKFIADFTKKHGLCDDNWVDFKVMGITGDIESLDPSLRIEYVK